MRRTTNALLWTAQILLAALFLFAGGMKLVAPAAALTKQIALPIVLLRFIGVCETLGAFGLVLPGVLRVQRRLTAVAAAGLVIIMSGAVGVTLAAGQGALALVPGAVGAVALTIAAGRREWLATPGAPRVRASVRTHASFARAAMQDAQC